MSVAYTSRRCSPLAAVSISPCRLAGALRPRPDPVSCRCLPGPETLGSGLARPPMPAAPGQARFRPRARATIPPRRCLHHRLQSYMNKLPESFAQGRCVRALAHHGQSGMPAAAMTPSPADVRSSTTDCGGFRPMRCRLPVRVTAPAHAGRRPRGPRLGTMRVPPASFDRSVFQGRELILRPSPSANCARRHQRNPLSRSPRSFNAAFQPGQRAGSVRRCQG